MEDFKGFRESKDMSIEKGIKEIEEQMINKILT